MPVQGYTPAPDPAYGQTATYMPAASGYQPEYSPYNPGYPEAPQYPPMSPYLQPFGAYTNPTAKNGTCSASLIMGIISFFCLGPILGIPAIILGANGRKAANEGQATNGGMATAGMVLGIISTIFVVIVWIIMFASS
jgi:hypothetical protein